MTFIKVVAQIALLEAFYLLGNAVSSAMHIPIPGNIIGMLLLFMALIIRIIPVKWIEKGSRLLLNNLPLLFIPITVGVMNEFQLFAGSGIILFFITLISTVLVMIASGLTSHYLTKRKERKACKEHLSESS